MRWRPVLVDGAVAVVAFGLSATAVATTDEPLAADLREPNAVAYVLLAVYSVSIVVRRRSPEVAVFGGFLAGVAYAAAAFPPALTPVALLSMYTAGAELPARRSRIVLAGGAILGAIGTTWAPGPTNPGIPVVVAAAWLLGQYVRSQRAYAAEMAERAATEERLRIARELHDVVAHTMGVVAVHAGAGRMVAEDDPAAARDALATIETATRAALVEMRRLLGVLRAPDERTPAPGLADVRALITDVEKAGVTVDLIVEGDRPDVPPGVDLTAYRIVQEALTNVVKHAAGANATVAIRYSADAVTIRVDDDGPGPRPGTTSGYGVAGMRERVAVYDGDLTAEAKPAGGFRVVATLPFGEPA